MRAARGVSLPRIFTLGNCLGHLLDGNRCPGEGEKGHGKIPLPFHMVNDARLFLRKSLKNETAVTRGEVRYFPPWWGMAQCIVWLVIGDSRDFHLEASLSLFLIEEPLIGS